MSLDRQLAERKAEIKEAKKVERKIEEINATLKAKRVKELEELTDIFTHFWYDLNDYFPFLLVDVKLGFRNPKMWMTHAYEIKLEKIKQFIRNHTRDELKQITFTTRGTDIFQMAALFLPKEVFVEVFNTPARDESVADLAYRIKKKDLCGNSLYKYAVSNDLFRFGHSQNAEILKYLDDTLKELGEHFQCSKSDKRPYTYIPMPMDQEWNGYDVHGVWSHGHGVWFQEFGKPLYRPLVDDLESLSDKLKFNWDKRIHPQKILHKMLKLAVKEKNLDLITTIINEYPEYWTKPLHRGNTFFHYIAGRDEVVDALIIKREILSAVKEKRLALKPNQYGKTPLSIARKAGKKAQKTHATLLKYIEPTLKKMERDIEFNILTNDTFQFIFTLSEEESGQFAFNSAQTGLLQLAAKHLSVENFAYLLRRGLDLRKQYPQEYAQIIFNLERNSIHEFAAKTLGLIICGADLTAKSPSTNKTLAHYVLSHVTDDLMLSTIAGRLTRHGNQDEPLVKLLRATDVLVAMNILEAMPADEVAIALALLNKRIPMMVCALASEIKKSAKLSQNVDALQKMAQCLEKTSPEDALFYHVKALNMTNDEDKKKQTAIRSDILRVKQQVKTQGREKLIHKVNATLALKFKNELATLSRFNLIGRVKIFRQIEALAKVDRDAKLILADCYNEGLAPGLQFNQRAKALAIYKELSTTSYYAEWKIFQLAQQREFKIERVHNALLASFRLLTSREPKHQQQKALAYILRCSHDDDLNEASRYFAQMISGVVSGEPSKAQFAYKQLERLDASLAAQMKREIQATMDAAERKRYSEPAMQQAEDLDLEMPSDAQEVQSTPIYVQTAPQPSFDFSVAPKRGLQSTMSYTYLELGDREAMFKYQDKYQEEALASVEPCYQELSEKQKANLAILTAYNNLMRQPSAELEEDISENSIEMKIMNADKSKQAEAERVAKVEQIMGTAPSTTWLNRLSFWRSAPKATPNAEETKRLVAGN